MMLCRKSSGDCSGYEGDDTPKSSKQEQTEYEERIRNLLGLD